MAMSQDAENSALQWMILLHKAEQRLLKPGKRQMTSWWFELLYQWLGTQNWAQGPCLPCLCTITVVALLWPHPNSAKSYSKSPGMEAWWVWVGHSTIWLASASTDGAAHPACLIFIHISNSLLLLLFFCVSLVPIFPWSVWMELLHSSCSNILSWNSNCCRKQAKDRLVWYLPARNGSVLVQDTAFTSLMFIKSS